LYYTLVLPTCQHICIPQNLRYNINDKVTNELLIDGVTPWTECPIHNLELNPLSPPPGVQITSDNIHVIVETTCTVPSNIAAGSHTLKVTPTIS